MITYWYKTYMRCFGKGAKKKEKKGKIVIDSIYGPVADRTLANHTLFWMASGWCDLQPQVIWSVFVCGP
jgi:hypothetical protein